MENFNGDALKRQVKHMLVAKLRAIGEGVADLAREKCPVRTGKLRDSIIYVVNEDELKVAIGATHFTARFVELGTHDQAPEPYLRPALAEAASVLRQEMH
ncbi:MAG: Bacteriophage HK97-gp10, putative tail-component [Planctomycetota bacterium]|nr:Bacteriophage HK97-gp10, putative tail-component [Planctomycetota bacterium]